MSNVVNGCWISMGKMNGAGFYTCPLSMDVLQRVANEVKQPYYEEEDYNNYNPLDELNDCL